jgi:hypothetical protein
MDFEKLQLVLNLRGFYLIVEPSHPFPGKIYAAIVYLSEGDENTIYHYKGRNVFVSINGVRSEQKAIDRVYDLYLEKIKNEH